MTDNISWNGSSFILTPEQGDGITGRTAPTVQGILASAAGNGDIKPKRRGEVMNPLEPDGLSPSNGALVAANEFMNCGNSGEFLVGNQPLTLYNTNNNDTIKCTGKSFPNIFFIQLVTYGIFW